MRVAMEGSFLRLPPSGTGSYVRALTASLRALDPTLDLVMLDPDWVNDADASARRANPLIRRLSALPRDRRIQRARWELAGVARAARRVGPDLIHIPHFSAPIRPDAPLVVTIHDVIPLILPEYRSSMAMRAHVTVVRGTVRRARLILTPSLAAASDIARVLGVPHDRLRVTPEAAGAEYKPPADAGTAREAVRRLGVTGRFVFNVGGLDVRKNLPVLLEAFARVRLRLNEPVQLVIAGSAHTGNAAVYPPLEPVVQRLGLAGAVLLPGRISEADKIALYQAADLYVTPSLYEGFGLTAVEAMACGAPTIAANRTSLPEVVGDAGILVEPEPDEVAAAMVSVLSNPDLAADLRTRGLARAATFTWRRTAELTLAAYHEALEGERGSAID